MDERSRLKDESDTQTALDAGTSEPSGLESSPDKRGTKRTSARERGEKDRTRPRDVRATERSRVHKRVGLKRAFYARCVERTVSDKARRKRPGAFRGLEVRLGE